MFSVLYSNYTDTLFYPSFMSCLGFDIDFEVWIQGSCRINLDEFDDVLAINNVYL